MTARATMYVGVDGRIVGPVAVADKIKDDSVRVIGRLRVLGLEVAMLTGDDRRTASAIARQIRRSTRAPLAPRTGQT